MNVTATLTRTPPDATPPRAVGALRLSVRHCRGASHISTLRQSGSLKALFPRPTSPALEVVLLNTAGGLTGGDRMQIAVAVEDGAHVVLSSQAAERAYRAVGQTRAEVSSELRIDPGGRLDWLPQETIVYNGAAVARRLQAEVAENGRLLLVEPVIFGRAAMGETVQSGQLKDAWRVKRAGELVFADAVMLQGDIAATLARSGIGGGAGAMASVLYVGPDAATFQTRVSALLPPAAGCSLIRDGVLFSRILARDGFDLRKILIPVVEYLSAAPLPKVWRL